MLQHPTMCLQRYNICAFVYHGTNWVTYDLLDAATAYGGAYGDSWVRSLEYTLE